MRPGASDPDLAEELACYFNAVSSEFSALEPDEIPQTYDEPLPTLQVWEVAGRIKHFRKPKSMVAGDIFPQLMTLFADQLAVPLTSIYNSISATTIWPVVWKQEFVTVIPKTTHPQTFGNLRNISCTMLASKIYESFVLNWSQQQVRLKSNQFGGVKGSSTAHMLLNVMQDICQNAEDYRAATVITSIDYAKAFNRLSFQHCLSAFARKGASSQILRIIATFLSNRTMAVQVGTTWSSRRPVTGGCPQGSILGVLLFNTTTDDLEDEFLMDEEQEVDDNYHLLSPDAPE